MKTFRLIGIAIMAILISVNFIACSSDDDEELIKNEDGVITNQKRLTRIEMVNDGISTWTFSYDSKGRLVFKKGGVTGDTNYTWGNNVIMATDDDNESMRIYTLSNNLVKSISDTDDGNWSNATLSYNSNNQLTKVQDIDDFGTNTESYTWQGDKITKLTYQSSGEYIYEYTYSGKTCKGYFPLYSPSDNDEIFYVHPELIGLRCSQLPDQIYYKNKYDEEIKIKKYTYTFDNDGYIESCTAVYTEKSSDRTHTYTTIYTFTWE